MLFRVDCANPCREKAQLTGVCTEGFQKAIADFVRFHALWNYAKDLYG